MSSARNKRRRRRGRARTGFFFKLLFVAAVMVAITLGVTVFFQVEEVAVVGNQRYTVQEVVSASGIQEGENLFQLNKNDIARQILEQLPYTQSLTIKRVLPNKILITVEEWQAVAQVESEEQWWLISVGGKLLEADFYPDVISVSGISPLSPRAGTALAVSQEETAKLTALLGLLSALEGQAMLDKVSDLDLSHPSYITFLYEERFEVRLLQGADYAYKLRALEAVVADREEYETGTMDLTQDNNTVLYSPG